MLINCHCQKTMTFLVCLTEYLGNPQVNTLRFKHMLHVDALYHAAFAYVGISHMPTPTGDQETLKASFMNYKLLEKNIHN